MSLRDFAPVSLQGRLSSLAALLIRLFWHERRWTALALMAAAALSGLALLPAALLGRLVDHAFAHGAAASVAAIAAALLAAALAEGALGYARRMLAARTTIAMRRDLAAATFDAALRLPIDDPAARDHGLLGRTFEEVERVAHVASEGMIEIVLGLGTVTVLGAALLVVNPQLGAGVLAIYGALAATHLWAARRLREREAAWLDARGGYWSHLVESIAYGLTVRIAPGHAFARRRFGARLDADLAAGLRVTRLTALLDAAGRMAGGLVTAAIALFGGLQVVAGAMTLGAFVLFLAVGASLSAPLLALAKAVDDLQAAMVGAGRIGALATAVHEDVDTRPDRDGNPGEGDLAASGLNFAYPGGPALLVGVGFELRRGARVALRGPSGLGKTTLASLIAGLRRAGGLTLDGVPLERIPVGVLRHRIKLVPHEIDVFTATVAENIALGAPTAPAAQIAEAARIAALDDVVAALAQGYETALGAGGVELSAGQKQRLGIARAVLCRPQILILDESTSALDAATEARVFSNLFAARPDMSVLAITHRASVAERMERTITLSQPRPQDAAPHGER